MSIEAGALATTVVINILLPYLKEGAIKLASEVREKAGQAAADYAAGVADKVWNRVKATFTSQSDQVVVDQFEQRPEAAAQLLTELLKEKLEQDKQLAQELYELVNQPGPQSDQNAVQIIADTVGYADARHAVISGGIVAGYVGSIGAPPQPGPVDPPSPAPTKE